MSYLVDTNVFSESAKRSPNERLVAWLRSYERCHYLSTITVCEIRRGIELLPEGRRKEQLGDWLQRLCGTMKGRILGSTPPQPTFGGN